MSFSRGVRKYELLAVLGRKKYTTGTISIAGAPSTRNRSCQLATLACLTDVSPYASAPA